MAPLDTTTNEAPGRAAMASARRPKTPVSAASVLEPILTTMRRARAHALRRSPPSAARMGQQVVERGIEALHQPARDPGGDAEQPIDERRHRVALIVDRGRLH